MKRGISLFLFSLALTLSIGSVGRVLACSCVPTAPCQNYDRADVVFLGKVVGAKFQTTALDYSSYDGNSNTSASNEPKKITYDVGEIYFEVVEAFRGTEKGAKLTVHSTTGGGDCGYWFKRGESYVVFAVKEKSDADSGISSMTGGGITQKLKPDSERLWTSLCSGTKEFRYADEALNYLRNLPEAGAGGTIYGVIYGATKDYSSENVSAKPMVDTKVEARQIGGGNRIFYGTTNENGIFEIRVPAGTYLVTPVLSPTLTFESRYKREENTAPLKIEDTKCDTKFFWVTNDSEIKGKVLDADGKPNGDVVLHLIPADKERKDKGFDYKFAIVEADGSFSFKGLPPGRYQISLNYTDNPDDDSPFPTTFYPKTGVRAEAKIFEIGDWTKFDDIIFRLPPKMIKRSISGTVVWKNGKAASGAEVRLRDVEADRDVFFKEVTTNAKGEFSTEWFEGRKYQIKVIFWKTLPNGSGIGIAEAETEIFTLDAATQKFKIVLNTINPNEKSITRTTVRAN